jgi:hypothetical protein
VYLVFQKARCNRLKALEKAMTNVETLQAAGLIEMEHPLTEDEVASVNQLSSAEVDALISVKAKLGEEFFKRKVHTPDGHRLGTMIF